MDHKKKAFFKIAGIGLFHSFLYLWLVPFVVVPLFGERFSGIVFAIVGAFSVSVVFTLFVKGRRKKNRDCKRD